MGFQSAFNRTLSTIGGAILGGNAMTTLQGENKRLAAENVKLAASERAAKISSAELENEFNRHLASTKDGRKKIIERRLEKLNNAINATNKDEMIKTALRDMRAEETNDGNS